MRDIKIIFFQKASNNLTVFAVWININFLQVLELKFSISSTKHDRDLVKGISGRKTVGKYLTLLGL